MPDLPSRPTGSKRSAIRPTLTDRVLARVTDAGLAVDQRTAAARRKASRYRLTRPDAPAAGATRSPAQVREARSLRRVFSDLGLSYRRYRRETGAPVSRDVRDAACRFRRERDVASLVSVAACLDALDILTW
ncbi:MAG: hypothetical protein ABIQ49_15220 [Gemmatimonadales bacterium]